MKISLVLGAFGSLAAVTALWQQTVPTALRGHVDTLNAAQSLTAKVAVTPVGGAPEEIKLTFSKPNFWKVETAGGFQLFDGHKIFAYDAAKKTYTETDATAEAGLAALNAMPEAWAWTAFFNPSGLKDVSTAQRGKARKVRGLDVTEMTLGFSKQGRASTFFMDDKVGVARGLTFKEGDKDFVAIATEFALGKEALAESTFAFTAPEGATKAVFTAPTASYKDVQALFNRSCMPCHNGTNHRGNYNLSSYESVMASSGAVNVDHPEESFIIRSLKGDRAQRMPYNKAALPAAQIQLVYDWMKAGAKNE